MRKNWKTEKYNFIKIKLEVFSKKKNKIPIWFHSYQSIYKKKVNLLKFEREREEISQKKLNF